MIKLNKIIAIFGLSVISFFLSPTSLDAQTMYDAWKRSNTKTKTSIGLSVGFGTGLDINIIRPRRNVCKVLNKKKGVDIGVYYEGLVAKNVFQNKYPDWDAGGIRGSVAFVYYPDIRIEANRMFFGAGIESGTRKLAGESTIATDLVAKWGWEFSFMPLNGWPLVLRASAKVNYQIGQERFFVFAPTLGFLIGK